MWYRWTCSEKKEENTWEVFMMSVLHVEEITQLHLAFYCRVTVCHLCRDHRHVFSRLQSLIVATLVLGVLVVWLVNDESAHCLMWHFHFSYFVYIQLTYIFSFHIYFQGNQKTEISTALKWDGAVCSLQNEIFYATIPLSMALNICEFCLKQLIRLSYSRFVCMYVCLHCIVA